VAKSKPGHRVALLLDPRIALEAIILNRYERIPSSRRQEWLRGLLLQGFRVECQALRATSSDSAAGIVIRSSRFSPGINRASARKPETNPAVVETTPSQVDVAEKPFAALGKVIG
jgi:hypothetical protein